MQWTTPRAQRRGLLPFCRLLGAPRGSGPAGEEALPEHGHRRRGWRSRRCQCTIRRWRSACGGRRCVRNAHGELLATRVQRVWQRGQVASRRPGMDCSGVVRRGGDLTRDRSGFGGGDHGSDSYVVGGLGCVGGCGALGERDRPGQASATAGSVASMAASVALVDAVSQECATGRCRQAPTAGSRAHGLAPRKSPFRRWRRLPVAF